MDAEKILSDVNPENYFYVCNGSVLKNLEDLRLLLENLDASAFSHHVNECRNDFSNWTREVIQDETLARNFLKVNTREDALNALKRRISFLKGRVTLAKKQEDEEGGEKKPFKPVDLRKRQKKEIVDLLKRNP